VQLDILPTAIFHFNNFIGIHCIVPLFGTVRTFWL